MRDSSLDTWNARHIPILNRRDVPPRDRQIDFDSPRPVTATIQWQTGPETITTRAIAWCGRGRLRRAGRRAVAGARGVARR